MRQSAAMVQADEPKGFFRAPEGAPESRRRLAGARSAWAAARSQNRRRVLEDLETRLLTADVGVEATGEILADLNRRVARHELDDVEALLNALRERLVELLAPCERALTIDPRAKPFVVLVVGVNGSGKTTSIGKLAQRLAARASHRDAGGGRYVPRRRRRAALGVGGAHRRIVQRAADRRRSGRGDLRCAEIRAGAARGRGARRYRRSTAQPDASDGRAQEGPARDPARRSDRAARGAAGARRQPGTERAHAGAAVPCGARGHGPGAHQARWHGARRHRRGDRASARHSDPLPRRG